MSMILVTLRLKTDVKSRMNILKTIHSMTGLTSAQPECVNCELFSGTQNDDQLILLQIWKSKKALRQHIQSDEFRKVMAAMDSASEPPELLFYETNNIPQGMEFVEETIGWKS